MQITEAFSDKLFSMEILSLFDQPFIEEHMEKPESVVQTPVKVTRELDYDFLQEIERSQLSKQTLKSELDFLTSYYERFKFDRDRIRLETLQYYFEQEAC